MGERDIMLYVTPMTMLALMYVAIGGAVGSMGRYALMTVIGRFNASGFPYGTLTVNVLGSFLMGAWIAVMAAMMPARAKDLHTLFAIGLLGGFTTFSTFSIDLFLLIERGQMMQATLYMVGSVGASLLALTLGMWLLKILT